MRILNYDWCSENGKSDKEFLGWIFARLQNVYGDNYLKFPHMRRLAEIIDAMPGELPKAPNKHNEDREKFRKALADAGFSGFTVFSSPVLEAYDKVHCPELRK